jgi:hypothetical protein
MANFVVSDGQQGSPTPLSVENIREQLQMIEAMRRELDEAALKREQLNQVRNGNH